VKVIKRNVIIGIVALCCFSLLSTGLIQPIQTIIAEECLADLCSEHYRSTDNDYILCSTNSNIATCSVPASDRVSKDLTREKTGSLLYMPGYFTPKRIAISDKENNNWQRSASNSTPIKALVLIDEEAVSVYYRFSGGYLTSGWVGCCIYINHILKCGSDYLKARYGIDFQARTFLYWPTDNTLDYYGLIENINAIDPADYDCDVVVLMSGQDGGYTSRGGKIVGLALHMGNCFIVNVNNGLFGWHSDGLANIFQHEASHLFGCGDHKSDHATTSTPCCIMCYRCGAKYSAYCTDCDEAIWQNRFHFDTGASL
jgi:hypothetical protein